LGLNPFQETEKQGTNFPALARAYIRKKRTKEPITKPVTHNDKEPKNNIRTYSKPVIRTS
jgi:hypothetical protein